MGYKDGFNNDPGNTLGSVGSGDNVLKDNASSGKKGELPNIDKNTTDALDPKNDPKLNDVKDLGERGSKDLVEGLKDKDPSKMLDGAKELSDAGNALKNSPVAKLGNMVDNAGEPNSAGGRVIASDGSGKGFIGVFQKILDPKKILSKSNAQLEKGAKGVQMFSDKLGIKLSSKAAKYVVIAVLSGSGLGATFFATTTFFDNGWNVLDDGLGICSFENDGSGVDFSATAGDTGDAGDWLEDGTTENENAKKVIKLLKGEGLSGVAIAGVLGNYGHESMFRTAVQNDKGNGQTDGGYGISQWTFERRDGLFALAKKENMDVNDINLQLKQMKLDFENKDMWFTSYFDKFSPEIFNNSKTPEEAATRFYMSAFIAGGYQTSIPSDDSHDKRMKFAKLAYSKFDLAGIKGDASKLSGLLGGDSTSLSISNAETAASANDVACSEDDVSDPTSNGDILDIAESLDGYFTYAQVRPVFSHVRKDGKDEAPTKLSQIDKRGQTDCSGYIYLVLSMAKVKGIDKVKSMHTESMRKLQDGWGDVMEEIPQDKAKAGDILVVSKGTGDDGHVGFLMEDYSGNDIGHSKTKVINCTNWKNGVVKGTVHDMFLSLIDSGIEPHVFRVKG